MIIKQHQLIGKGSRQKLLAYDLNNIISLIIEARYRDKLKIITIDYNFAENAVIILKKSFMDISKIVLIFGISLLIYSAFLFLGFFLKNKNLKAQNLKKEE